MRSLNGFTLAEVLITLGIIGIVAALTMPTLISSYKKQQTVVHLKKVYSLFNQAMLQAVADNGPVASWQFAGAGNENAVNFTNQYIIPYLKVVKNCGTNTTNECNFIKSGLNGAQDVFRYSLTVDGFTKIYLSDGTEIAILGRSNPSSPVRHVYVDINGNKAPNTVGKDVFELEYNISRGTFVPRYLLYASLEDFMTGDGYSACTKTQIGHSCAALIRFEGWQITENYPW